METEMCPGAGLVYYGVIIKPNILEDFETVTLAVTPYNSQKNISANVEYQMRFVCNLDS